MREYFDPDPVLLQAALDRCEGEIVVDVGGAVNPFPKATHIFDIFGENSIQIDIEQDALPFGIDFLYCRHVVEDLNSPVNFLRQVNKKVKRGHIEFPSLQVECCRGVEHGAPWRGLWHHRWFVYVEDGSLTFLPKYPVAAFMEMEGDDILEKRLEDQRNWNRVFAFDGPFPWEVINPARHRWSVNDYLQEVARVLNREIADDR